MFHRDASLFIPRNISMRTSTNFFIFTLASADIMTLLSGSGDRGQLPPSLNELFAVLGATFDLSVYWQQYPFLFDGLFGEGVCRLRAFLSEM